MLYINFINVLLKIILNQYFTSTRCVILLSDEKSNQVQLPLGVSAVSVSVQLNESASETSKKLFINYGCQVFILNLDSPAFALSNVEQGIKNQNETFFKRNYIIINNNGNINQLVTRLLESKEVHFIANLLIISMMNQTEDQNSPILRTSTEVYSLWTPRYVGLNGSLEFQLADKWFSSNQSFLNKDNLFPDNINKRFGKVYKIGYFDYLPYIFHEWNHKTNRTILDGLEGIIINEFFKKYKLSMQPYLVLQDYWGDVFDNGTVYGLRGILYQDKVDISVAANFATDRMYRYFGITVPILRLGITCLVPAPKLIASWLTPMHVYSKPMWKMIFFGYIIIVLSIYFTQFISHLKVFNNLSTNKYVMQIKKFGEILFLICTQHFEKTGILKGCSGAIFIALTLFVTFFLSRSYESGLASIMTIPSYENSIETANDFFNSNISWGGIQIADWIMHWETDEEESYRRAYKRYLPASSEKLLKELLAAGNFGLLIERISADHFHFPFPSLETSKEIKLMKEDIHWEYSVFLLRKSSPLIPELNKFILTLKQGGLVNYWLDQAAAKVQPQRGQKEMSFLSQHYSSATKKLVKLKLAHVAGAFGIVVIGNLIALLVFLAELVYSSKCQHKNKES